MVPLKYLSNFWRTLEIPLINCRVSLLLTWSSTCVITNCTGAGRFDTKIYVPVVTLSIQDYSKLLQQLKSGFKRVVNWNKHLSKRELLAQNPSLNHLVELSFQGINRHLCDPRVVEQINFTENLSRAGNTRIYFILEEPKQTKLDFSQGTVKVL